MKFKNPLLVVTDLEKSKAFYKSVLGLNVIEDFGANVTLTGGICLQTEESYASFIGASDIAFGGKNAELYFEEEDFDRFASGLNANIEVTLLHPAYEHPWGQRAVRFYDPDNHIIEVGEPLCAVVKRFLDSGLDTEQTAKRMDIPVSLAKRLTK